MIGRVPALRGSQQLVLLLDVEPPRSADELRRARAREAYANDPAAKRARRERHASKRERHSENHRRWYAANRAARIEADRKWRADNPEKARAKARQQNRRKRLGRDATSIAWSRIVMADPCVYCGAASEHLDHIDPVAGGGSNHWTNLTGACATCNVRKADAPLLIALLRQNDAALRHREPSC